MLPRTLYGSQCVLHYIHSSCPQRHVSLPLAQVLNVEASLVLCRAAEWETTQLSTHDHVDQGPHKQIKQTKHSVKTEKSESDASTACSDFYKAEAFLCLLSTRVTEVGISSIRCPAISLRKDLSSVTLQDTKLSYSKNVCLAAWLTLPTVSDTISKS